MTSKERFLTALRNEVPDMVPVAPDFSNYIPAKRTGLPFWKVYFEQEVPLWKAYLETAEHFGIDAWMASCLGAPVICAETDCEAEETTEFNAAEERMVRRHVFRTPHGTLTSTTICPKADPPTQIEKPIKDLLRDLPAFHALRGEPLGLDPERWAEMRETCDRGGHAFGISVGYPGFHAWSTNVAGGVAPLAYAEMDNPALLEEWFERDLARGTRVMELVIAGEPDYILLGGSGTITMASPDLARKYALPAIKRFSRMAREANIPVHLHSCGNSRALVEMLATETDVGSINPLEEPPMGDIDLAEVKQAFGDRIGLMGNLHTTRVMLRGTPELVREESIAAMRAAGPGGGFILSTGDQCGRDTPDENLFTLVETARDCGRYAPDGTLPDLP